MIDSVIETISTSLAIRKDTLSADTPLRKVLRDSIDAVELIAVLTERYRVQIEPGDLDRIETVGDVARYVEAHAEERTASDPLDVF
jgi:acyl carrier protein